MIINKLEDVLETTLGWFLEEYGLILTLSIRAHLREKKLKSGLIQETILESTSFLFSKLFLRILSS